MALWISFLVEEYFLQFFQMEEQFKNLNIYYHNNDFNLQFLMMWKFISLVGTQMQSFALSLYVYKKTDSASMFASVIVAALIPQILLSLIAEVFADWIDRKKIIVYLDILSGLVFAGFALEYFFVGGHLVYMPYQFFYHEYW